ncbi:hypothetical protein Bbelb_070320 [Branchiostoma belcheri]|nr:hypothetical protein Bbelb_070320 [Branchiostoma belcheri]
MYWVNWVDDDADIGRAAMDGSNQTTIIRNTIRNLMIWAITIDYTENRLYYSDNDAIYSSDMLGNNIQLVKPGDGEPVTGIAAGADYIYWTHYLTGEVIRQEIPFIYLKSRDEDPGSCPKQVLPTVASPAA